MEGEGVDIAHVNMFPSESLSVIWNNRAVAGRIYEIDERCFRDISCWRELDSLGKWEVIECGTQVEIFAFHRKTSFIIMKWKEVDGRRRQWFAQKLILLKYLVVEEEGVLLLVLSPQYTLRDVNWLKIKAGEKYSLLELWFSHPIDTFQSKHTREI